MNAGARRAFEPRKTPVQARSAITVAAIFEATIQVLLSHGAERLTTTRVAERAGVSVGTLYQYHPNKQSLLFGLLEQHMDRVAATVERACEQSRGKPLADMMDHVVVQLIEVKMERTDISTALYRISADLGGPELVKRTEERSRRALEAMIATAPDAAEPDPFAVQIMYAAMAGAIRTVLEAGAAPAMVRKLREHLVVIAQASMRALSDRPS